MTPAKAWKLTQRQRETLDRICDLGCQKLAARAMGITTRTIQVNLNNMRHENGLQLVPPLKVLLAWDAYRRAD
jgi:DNA-binding CsgD family transcriptional regulator